MSDLSRASRRRALAALGGLAALAAAPPAFSARAAVASDEHDRGIHLDSGHDPVFGVGIGVTVAKHLNLRAEYERIEINDLDDANAVWLTAAWRF